MANTTTTPASVASRLTDEEIELLAQAAEQEIQFWEAADAAAAVLRDYVRMRKLENAVKLKVKECELGIILKDGFYDELKHLLAEKGGAK